jgi:hypothetical protein
LKSSTWIRTTSPAQEAVFDLSLFTKDLDPAPSLSGKGFLDLPPELRVKIYGYATLETVEYDDYDDYGDYGDYGDYDTPPGARVIPSLALAFTCRQVYNEHITGPVAAHRRHIWLGTQNIRRRVNCGIRSLEIILSPEYPSARIIDILGIGIVDRFDDISIVGSWDSGCPKGVVWSLEGGWRDREIRRQIGLAGGPLAFGWSADLEAFYRRATFEKAMERADFYWKYKNCGERGEARTQHPALFLKYAHPSVSARTTKRRPWVQCLEGPKRHELGPITFKFASTAKQNNVGEGKLAGFGSESEGSRD